MSEVDYKRQAEELFEILVTMVGLAEDTEAFGHLCKRFPELMENYVAKIEKEAEDADIPELTPEESDRMKY